MFKVDFLDMHNNQWRHVIVTETELLRGQVLRKAAEKYGSQERYVNIYKIERITQD